MVQDIPSDLPPGSQSGPLDAFLCFTVYSTGLAFNRVYKPLLDKLGLTYVQYLVMVSLMDRNDQTVSELGDQLFLESNTLTPLLKRMEAAGLVTRTRDKKDERVVRVRLTDQGRSVGCEAECVPDEILAATGLTREQLTDLQANLSKLHTTLRANAAS